MSIDMTNEYRAELKKLRKQMAAAEKARAKSARSFEVLRAAAHRGRNREVRIHDRSLRKTLRTLDRMDRADQRAFDKQCGTLTTRIGILAGRLGS